MSEASNILEKNQMALASTTASIARMTASGLHCL